MNLIRAMRVPLIVWLILEGVAAASLVWSAQELPPRVASHFNFQGQANGWMSRTTHLEFMGGIGLLLPLFLLGTGLLMGVMPAGSINIPGRDYWLASERRHETNAYLARHMTWFACAMTAFFIGLNWLVVEANRDNPPRLSNGIWLMLVPFLVFTLAWLIVLVTHFSRVPREAGKVP
jgi:uncharacterized protein DUF1648